MSFLEGNFCKDLRKPREGWVHIGKSYHFSTQTIGIVQVFRAVHRHHVLLFAYGEFNLGIIHGHL